MFWIRENMELHIFGRSWDGRESNFGSISFWSCLFGRIARLHQKKQLKPHETVNNLQVSPVASIWMTPAGFWRKSTVSTETLESFFLRFTHLLHFFTLDSWQFSAVHRSNWIRIATWFCSVCGRWSARTWKVGCQSCHVPMCHAFVKARQRW